MNIKKQMLFAVLCGITVLSAYIGRSVEKLSMLLQMEVVQVC